MKRILWVLIPLLPVLTASAQSKTVKPAKPASPAAAGYSIQLDIKPFKNQWIYLAYYYGGIKGLADSAFLNADSKGVFKGKAPLQQGIYIVASPHKSILFEMLIGADQQFAVSADSAQLDQTLTFTGSEENQQFIAYSQFINPRARAAEEAREQMRLDSMATDKSKYQSVITKSLAEIDGYRQNVIKTQPESLLSVLFKSMQEHKLPANLLNPKNRQDSIAQYRWGKEHYWDGVDFMDGRLVRTPIFEGKLKGYLENWVVPDADSLIYEFNWMIALGRNDPEMFKYLIGYFVDNYMYPKIMGQDKVFLHVYQRYISGDKPKADWLNEKQIKTITERAYMVMANQLGTPAWDMELLDTAGKVSTLYNVKAEYTVVAFWDVHCGKCREEIPKMDTLYNTKWKAKNVKIYAVMVNEESAKDWPAFIREHAKGWTHVHQPSSMKAEEEKAGKPNFRQLYDMRSTPTLYLLDKNKNIIAKNVGLSDLDNVLQEKIKRSAAGK
jgi:cytochrome oxidase Cu insertion factor (SCO1/SenC/PrrC family)